MSNHNPIRERIAKIIDREYLTILNTHSRSADRILDASDKILSSIASEIEKKRIDVSKVNPPYDVLIMQNGYNQAIDEVAKMIRGTND